MKKNLNQNNMAKANKQQVLQRILDLKKEEDRLAAMRKALTKIVNKMPENGEVELEDFSPGSNPPPPPPPPHP